MGGEWQWVGENWWYKLAHVCQRWRGLILGSVFYLGLSLVCTKGTPISDMLAHSPPLPLVIDYFDEYHDITAEDKEGIILALKQRGRVRRVRLHMLIANLQRLIMTIDGEYPILEYLVIMHQTKDVSVVLKLPETLQAPHLRHLALIDFALPIGSRLLTTAAGLVTLCLFVDHPTSYFDPNILLRWLSYMPQLETLAILFSFPIPNRDAERQRIHTPVTTPVTLSSLHCFRFRGVSTYLEALVCQISTPRLKKLAIDFFNQLTFSVPHLLLFMNATENPRFGSAKFKFSGRRVDVEVYRYGDAEMYTLSIAVDCWHLDWQVSSVAQISHFLRQMFSAVEHLTLEHEIHSQSSEEHNWVDRIEWRKLLCTFSNVKFLRIDTGLFDDLSRCLQADDGELPLELLPALQELTYSWNGNIDGAFTSFVDARQNAGRPITLVHRSPAETKALLSPFEPPSITLGSSEVGIDFDT